MKVIWGLLPILLIGCASTPAPIEVTPPPRVLCSPPPNVDPVKMRDVNPTVVQDTDGVFWIGISPKEYENLAENLQALLKQIRQRKAINEHFQGCLARYKPPEEK